MLKNILFSKKRFFSLAGGLLTAGLAIGAFSNTQAKGRPAKSEEPKWVPLFTVAGAERAGADAVAPQASRYRAVTINPLLLEEGGVAVGDRIFISAFEDGAVLGTVDRVGTDVNGVVAVRARIQGAEGDLLLSSDNGRSLGLLVLPDRREFEISCVKGGPIHVVKEFAPGARVALPGGPPLIPPSSSPSGPVLPPLVKAPSTAANVQIDCMIVYTPAARDYANSDSGINNYISQAMNLAQLGMDNSLVEITMHLVHSALVNYTEEGMSSQDLALLTYTYDEYMNDVHTWRDIYAADLVQLFTKTEDVGGISWLLDSSSGSRDYAFSVGRIQQINRTTTTVHEWGHNMGCHHRKDQLTQPGPGLFSYSAGWRWIGNDSAKYCSIMSYTDSYDGVTPTQVAYFSNPSVNYKGTPTGHAADGDNARTLREIKSVIANYRDTPPTISGTVKVGTTGLANVVMKGFLETVKTNAFGEYSGIVGYRSEGAIVPHLVGYKFSPPYRYYLFVTGNQTGQNYTATEVPVPRISLSKTSLNFGALAGGVSTSNQSIVVSNSGEGTLYWTATSNKSWLDVTPAGGTQTGILQISANLTRTARAGAYQGTITVADPDAADSPQTITVNLTIMNAGTSASPIGSFDTPTNGTTGVTGAIPVTGWVVDDIEVTRVEILRDNVAGETPGQWAIGDAIFVEGARPDIETALPGYPLNYRAGWGYMMLTNMLPGQGNGTIKLYAYATDKECNRVLLGTKTITCSNATAVKPFGAIDTPAQGGDASGSTFVNFGWVLTPMPKTVPIDGSTIEVYVDSVRVGDLKTAPNVYNQYRVDVATSFPGLNNSDGPVGAFFLDTTKYPDGVHTIFWIATDDAGAADGIGSRYFNIVNTGTAAQASTPAIKLAMADSYESLMNLPVSFEHRKAKRGFILKAEPEIIQPDNYGTIQVEIREVERVEVDLGLSNNLKGYLVVGNELRPLPIGSTLDANRGIFSWMSGAGFVGTYDLVFVRTDEFGITRKIPIKVTIKPKFEKK